MASLERYTLTGMRNGRCLVTNPWFKFYPTDWKADTQLKLCSAAARGFWMEMLCICHDAKPYGHFLINGVAPTDAELTVLTGIKLEQISELIGELSSRGIFSRTAKGVIYSRKLVRQGQMSSEGKKNGKIGGNPSLCKKTTKTKGLTPRIMGGDNTQKPEARVIFTGKVIRLRQKTFDALLAESGLQERDFVAFLDKEDEYFAKLAPVDRAKWYFFLGAKIKKMTVA